MEYALKVEGMMCTHCKAKVEKVCKAIEGVESAQVDLHAKTVTISGSVPVETVSAAITGAGYQVVG